MTEEQKPEISPETQKPVAEQATVPAEAAPAPEKAPEAPVARPAPKPETPKKRVLVYDGRELPDPDPKMPVDKVREFYAAFYPELGTAEALPAVDREPNETVIEFKRKVGTKGSEELTIHRHRPVVHQEPKATLKIKMTKCQADDILARGMPDDYIGRQIYKQASKAFPDIKPASLEFKKIQEMFQGKRRWLGYGLDSSAIYNLPEVAKIRESYHDRLEMAEAHTRAVAHALDQVYAFVHNQMYDEVNEFLNAKLTQAGITHWHFTDQMILREVEVKTDGSAN